MPTIGNEGLPGFSPGSDGVFGGGSAGLADFRFLLTFNAQQCSNLPHRSRWGAFGSQYLGLDSIRPTKCCPYFERCVFFKSQICGMEGPLCPVFDQIPPLPFVLDLHPV